MMTVADNLLKIREISCDVFRNLEKFKAATRDVEEKIKFGIFDMKTWLEGYHNFNNINLECDGNMTQILEDLLQQNLNSKAITMELESRLDILKEKGEQLHKNLSLNEGKLITTRKKVKALKENNQTLEALRNKAKLFKLFTSTTFDFQDTNVTGFIVNQQTNKIKVFNFDPKQIGQHEITESLLRILRDTFGDGCTKAKEDSECKENIPRNKIDENSDI